MSSNKLHYHSCPECFESPSCYMDCWIEPDLKDNNKEYGYHHICDNCELQVDRAKFFLKYNGFAK